MATTVTLGKLRFDWRGDFSTSNAYVINDVVTYRSQQYIAITDNPISLSGDRTPLNATLWTSFTSIFNNRGTWSSGVTYLPGDVVIYNTPGLLQPTNANFSLSRSVVQTYYCINTNTSSSSLTPIDPSYWQPVNRKGVLGTQTAPNASTGSYYLGVYGNSNYNIIGFANRGIPFDTQSNYRGGGHKNNTDSYGGMGVITQSGQAVLFGGTVNGSDGIGGYYTQSQNTLTFPFYDWWRSTSNSGTGIHATPDNGVPRVLQWERSYDHNLVLMNSGEVFAWGYGTNGENGNGANANTSYPVRVGGTLPNVYAGNTSHVFYNLRIKRISMSGGVGDSTSAHHCLALDESGNLYAWGYNGYGQMGNNSTTSSNVPVLIPRSSFATIANPSGQSVIAMWACGGQSGWSFAVTQDNQLWAWGYNVQGQLGVADNTNRLIPTLITTVAFGSQNIGNVLKVQTTDYWNGSTGDGASAILTSTGRIYVTGANVSGWMGNGNATATNTWATMGSGPGSSGNSIAYDMWIYGSGSTYTSIMIRDNTTSGTCYTCGYNNVGQLGYGGTATTSLNSISNATASKIQIAGSLYNLTKVKQLAWTGTTASQTVTIVTDTGFSFSLGWNGYGQASNGTTSSPAGALVDASGIENINSYVWQPVRTAPGMQGRFDDCMGFGTNNLAWKNSDGRWMITGLANNGNTPSYNAFVNSFHAFMMTTIPVD